MIVIYPLIEKFNQNLDWHQARIECFAQLIIGLLQIHTVNLTKLANTFGGDCETDSSYRRIQRFFQKTRFDFTWLARFIASLLELPESNWTLAMDRTNWKLGQHNLNFLVLAVVHEDTAFPLFWKLLAKRGNSNIKERQVLLNRFERTFGVTKLGTLLVDREFIGKQWLRWLDKHNKIYCIRIRSNCLLPNSRGILRPAKLLFQNLTRGESNYLGQRILWEVPVYLTGKKMEDGDYLILITSYPTNDALIDYAKRWTIETLFGSLKSRGFNLEDTHMTDLKKLSKLMALLAISFCWAWKMGHWRQQKKPIRIQTHQRKAKSVFRYGLDWLQKIMINRNSNKHLTIAFKLLSCT
jgi:hypothetical protein